MKQSELFECLTVSRKWYKLIVPILWNSTMPHRPILSCLPSFAKLDKKKNMRHFHQLSHCSSYFPIYNNYYNQFIKSVDLSKIASTVTDCTVQYLIEYCPNLQQINLSHCRLITDQSLFYISRIINQLQVLNLNHCRQITDIGLSYLVQNKLESIHLGHCHHITEQAVLSLLNPKSIKHLMLNDVHITIPVFQKILVSSGSSLESLDISRTKLIRDQTIQSIITYCPNLIRLSLSNKKRKLNRSLSTTEGIDRLEDLASDQQNPLTELIELLNRYQIQPHLSSTSAQHHQELLQRSIQPIVSFESIQSILTHCKKLTCLNLAYWNSINDDFVFKLLKQNHCLDILNLIGCHGITKRGRQALELICQRNSTTILLNDIIISPPTIVSNCSYESDHCSSDASSHCQTTFSVAAL